MVFFRLSPFLFSFIGFIGVLARLESQLFWAHNVVNGVVNGVDKVVKNGRIPLEGRRASAVVSCAVSHSMMVRSRSLADVFGWMWLGPRHGHRQFWLPSGSGGSLVSLLVPVFRKMVKLYAKDMLFLLLSTKWFSRREVKAHLA
jgi:hypothetical protein